MTDKHAGSQPDGRPATIKWVTVGGRTSAYVVELQKLKRRLASSTVRGSSFAIYRRDLNISQDQLDEADESDLTPLSGQEEETKVEKIAGKLKRKVCSYRSGLDGG